MDMFALLKQIDPPLGFGSKCPDLLAYKRLVRMNMPVDVEGKVHFKTTLFALVRVNLQIFLRSMDEMDQADQELRATISKMWPFTKRDGSIDLVVPPAEGNNDPLIDLLVTPLTYSNGQFRHGTQQAYGGKDLRWHAHPGELETDQVQRDASQEKFTGTSTILRISYRTHPAS